MSKGILIAIIIVVAVALAVVGYMLLGNNDQDEPVPAGTVVNVVGVEGQEPETNTGGGVSEGTTPGLTLSNTVEMSSSGFTPSSLSISLGDSVTFTNVGSSGSLWPATAVHPSHTVYPGSNSNLCGGSTENTIFDACTGIAPGESYTFTFTQLGSWKYHDHLRASRTGTIVVG